MTKSKRSIADLLASGKGARFKNTSFNLLDEAENIIQKSATHHQDSIPTAFESPITNTKQTPSNNLTNTKQDIVSQAIIEGNNEILDDKDKTYSVATLPLLPSESDTITHQTPSNNVINTKQLPNKNLANTNQSPSKNKKSPSNNLAQNLTNHQANTQQLPNEFQASSRLTSPLLSIVGLKRQILFFFYDSAKKHPDRITDPISITNLANHLQTTKKTVEVTLVRMLKEKLFKVYDSRKGRGGWSMFEIPDYLFHELFKAETTSQHLAITKQTPNNNPSQYPSQYLTEFSSSSGINISPTTTSAPFIPDKKELPQEWKDLDYSCLSSIGFRECHIQQIFESGKATAEMVQDSIDELSHDLKAGNHGMRSPLLVLLKQLRSKGEPYTAITPGYVSDQIKYERKQLEELERRNRELIELRQKQESLKNLPGELEKEARFQAWCKSLPSEQKKAIAPRATIEGSEMQLGLLRAHWETQINKTTN